MLKASEVPSDGWDGGDSMKAPRPGRGESPQYHLAVFFRKTAKLRSSFAPGQTRFIAVSPTCVWVPKVCRCLPGSDLGAVTRQLLRAQTCFVLPHLPLRGCSLAATRLHRAEVRARGGWIGTGSDRGEQEMSPSPLPWGKARSWCVVVLSQPWDESGRRQK